MMFRLDALVFFRGRSQEHFCSEEDRTIQSKHQRILPLHKLAFKEQPSLTQEVKAPAAQIAFASSQIVLSDPQLTHPHILCCSNSMLKGEVCVLTYDLETGDRQ